MDPVEPWRVPLADALLPWRFDMTSPGRHTRLCAEARPTLAEAQRALATLQG